MPAVIAGYARSPFTPAKKGELARTRPDDIAATVINGLIKETGVDPMTIEDLIVGTAFPEAEQGFNGSPRDSSWCNYQSLLWLIDAGDSRRRR